MDIDAVFRNRSKGSLTETVVTGTLVTTNTVPPSTTTTTYSASFGTKKDMTDVVSENYLKRINDGEIVNNPMTSFTESRGGNIVGPKFSKNVGGGNTQTYDYGNYWGNVVIGYPATDNTRPPDFLALLAEVETRARANVIQPDFQGLVSLAELRETLAYLSNPLKSGLKLARNFQKQRNVIQYSLRRELRKTAPGAKASETIYELRTKSEIASRTGRILGDLEDLYLEFRYGVRPLVSDIEAVALELIRNYNGPRVSARSNSLHSYETTVFSTVTDLGGRIHNTKVVDTKTLTIRCGFLYSHTLESTPTKLAQQFGMSWNQLPAAVWEATPLSFVVDWVLNVSDFIGAVTPKPGVKYLAPYTSVMVDSKAVMTDLSVSIPTWTTVRQTSGSVFSQKTSYSRTPSVALPLLTFKAYSLSAVGGDFNKVLDLLSLFHQRLAKC